MCLRRRAKIRNYLLFSCCRFAARLTALSARDVRIPFMLFFTFARLSRSAVWLAALARRHNYRRAAVILLSYKKRITTAAFHDFRVRYE